jgi:hypothetical protein
VVDIIARDIHFAPLLGLHPDVSVCFLVYVSMIHDFRSQGSGFGFHSFAGSAEYENMIESVKTTRGILHVTQWCIIEEFISSIHIEF